MNVFVKVCNECHIEKPLNDFDKHPTCKNGIQSKCKLCIKKHHIKNGEHIKQYGKNIG